MNSVDLEEVAYGEPPHQDLHFLQIQLFASLVLEELTSPFSKMQCPCCVWINV